MAREQDAREWLSGPWLSTCDASDHSQTFKLQVLLEAVQPHPLRTPAAAPLKWRHRAPFNELCTIYTQRSFAAIEDSERQTGD